MIPACPLASLSAPVSSRTPQGWRECFTHRPEPAPDHGRDDLDLEIHRDEQRREDCKAKGNGLAIRGVGRCVT